jgi:3,4-dihydroxy 2-butanone 4-phosphate synthase / GTP cyclohydrolase II
VSFESSVQISVAAGWQHPRTRRKLYWIRLSVQRLSKAKAKSGFGPESGKLGCREANVGFDNVPDAVEAIRRGEIVIVLDDEDRENEGDFTVAAEKISPDSVNFMARFGRGLICLAMTGERLDKLLLPQMVEGNQSRYGTAFTVSIEARDGVTTGISAADRATTILTAIDPESGPDDLVRPGHIFPLRARPGGVLERAGQTEAAVDLARMAGLQPAGVICEIMNEDGSMARGPQLRVVAEAHGLKMVTVADIIAFRLRTETFVRPVAEADLPTEFGNFKAVVFENALDGENHLALVRGNVRRDDPVLVRVQEQSTLLDVFHCPRGPSGFHLHEALRRIQNEEQGVLIYLRHEASGRHLADELTMITRSGGRLEAPAASGDLRLYGIGAQMLRHLGVGKIRLLTNHPRKLVGLQGYGLTVVEQVRVDPSE